MKEKVYTIWKDVLKKDNISPDDNFFEIGGHSLNAILLLTKINHEFNVKLPLRFFFENLTPGKMVEGLKTILGHE
jgi:acyl carrier protein